MIEEALVEALAQEHFNYIAEGGRGHGGGGGGGSPTEMGRRGSWPSLPSRGRRGEERGAGLLPWRSLLSPRTAMSLVTLVATVVAARHLRDFLAEFVREAFSPSSDGGSGGGAEAGGVAEAVRVNR